MPARVVRIELDGPEDERGVRPMTLVWTRPVDGRRRAQCYRCPTVELIRQAMVMIWPS
jgi:hypothetical protein